MSTRRPFLSAVRVEYATRTDGEPRVRWHVATGVDTARTLTTDELDAALHRLDADRHPWGKPGVVPDRPGVYHMRDRTGFWRGSSPWVVVLAFGETGGMEANLLSHDGCCVESAMDASPPFTGGSFETAEFRRWASEGPVTP